MASFALLPICSGFVFDLPRHMLGFFPRTEERPFRSVWSVEGAWGNVIMQEDRCTVRVCGGSVGLRAFASEQASRTEEVRIDGEAVSFSVQGKSVFFALRTVCREICILFR